MTRDALLSAALDAAQETGPWAENRGPSPLPIVGRPGMHCHLSCRLFGQAPRTCPYWLEIP